jgi:hypothetical protein
MESKAWAKAAIMDIPHSHGADYMGCTIELAGRQALLKEQRSKRWLRSMPSWML